jgi:branched-chain amino acid transport system substrate-binding protein
MICENESLLVGIAGPLSGERIAHAPLLHRATARLSDLDIDWLLEDDKATPATAVAVAYRFIEKKVDAVIGHFNSACAEAVIPLYRAHKIPLLLPASSQTSLTHGGGAFRLCSTDHRQAQLMAIATAQFSPPTVEIVVDNSAYSFRALRAFQEVRDCARIRIVHVTDSPGTGINCRLVFATCANALRVEQFLKKSHWNGVVIYSDDAHVEEFSIQSNDRDGIKTFVVGPSENYGSLVERACELVAMGHRSGTHSLYDWLVKSEFFSETGDALHATWKIYSLHKHSFIPIEISSIGKNESDRTNVCV